MSVQASRRRRSYSPRHRKRASTRWEHLRRFLPLATCTARKVLRCLMDSIVRPRPHRRPRHMGLLRRRTLDPLARNKQQRI